MNILIIGYGVIGKHMADQFPEAKVHDPDCGFDASDMLFDIAFVCVPTDSKENGAADTSIVEHVIEEHREHVEVFVIKSSCPPNWFVPCTNIVFSPEFFSATPHGVLTEEFIILGGGTPADRNLVAQAYEEIKPASFRIIMTDSTEARLVKYMDNSWLAAKVVFCNEMARISAAFGVNYTELRELWLMDPRVNPSHTFVYEETPYYDSHCLNKDIPALIRASSGHGYFPSFLNEIKNTNDKFKELVSEDSTLEKEEPYLCIVAWGLVILSFGYYVDAQVKKARQDNAPKDAYSWDSDEDRWHTMSEDLKNDHVRSLMDTYLSVLKRETA